MLPLVISRIYIFTHLPEQITILSPKHLTIPTQSNDATANDAAAKPDTPWNRLFARLDATIGEDAVGRHKGLGSMLMRGLKETEDVDEEEIAALKKDESTFTREEVGYMRFVIVTQRRSDELERMESLMVGD